MTNVLLRFFGLLIGVTAFCGCGHKGLVVYPVKGNVTYNGAALEDASVLFVPRSEKQHRATGMTNADGTFSVVTLGAEKYGAEAGEYDVFFTKIVALDTTGKPYTGDGEMVTKSMLPEKFNDPAKPLFEATVTKSRNKNVFVFELND